MSGELNVHGADAFTQQLRELACGEGASLAIDLSQLRSIDSSGLGALINLVTRSRLSDGRVILVAPGALISGVFDATSLDRWFEICDSLDEAARRLG